MDLQDKDTTQLYTLLLQAQTSLPGLRAGKSAKETLLSFQGWPVIASAILTGSAGPAKSKYVRVMDDEDGMVEAMMMMESKECSALVKILVEEQEGIGMRSVLSVVGV